MWPGECTARAALSYRAEGRRRSIDIAGVASAEIEGRFYSPFACQGD